MANALAAVPALAPIEGSFTFRTADFFGGADVLPENSAMRR
jgi:hypothetical protein